MGSEGSAEHWDAAYEQGHAARSWFQERPLASLEMLEKAGIEVTDSIIDIGGGASPLVDVLIDRGWSDLTVLDISAVGLRAVQERLAGAAAGVHWICADLLSWRPERRYAVWHDRAVLHFFPAELDRARYRRALDEATGAGSVAIFGVFSPEGPPRCSGLAVARYGVADLTGFVGPRWRLIASTAEAHRTPAGGIQHFTWAALRRS